MSARTSRLARDARVGVPTCRSHRRDPLRIRVCAPVGPAPGPRWQSRPGGERAVKSTVEHLSPTRVRLAVEVPFDELKPTFDQAYKKIAQQVRIPGFRPGKAPARILDQRLGRGVVLEEVVNNAVPEKY